MKSCKVVTLVWIALFVICSISVVFAQDDNQTTSSKSIDFTDEYLKDKHTEDQNSEEVHFEYEVHIINTTNDADEDSELPIEGAKIDLLNKTANSSELEMTDSSGIAILILKPNSTYEIKISKKGYLPKRLYISVSNLNKHEYNSVTFTLKKYKKSVFSGGAILGY